MSKKTRTIKVEALARVEGEGGMRIRVRDGQVTEVKLAIYEPPRFFEGFLRGRDYAEAPDITARICGICPVAYQMSACHAMEAACGVTVGGPLRELRRLLYCGEWIESHALHVFMLHAPDFLGYESAIHMATEHPELVERALKLKKVGNDVLALLGGRAVHPINVRVGGFYRLPSPAEFAGLVAPLEWAREACLETLPLLAGLDYPDFEQDYEFVALSHPDEYPFNEGRLVSNKGLDIDIAEYEENFVESHVEHSNALHSHLRKRGNYFVGPLARYSLNFDKLPESIQRAALAAGLQPVCRNPFKSILVRTIELLYACDEALRILAALELPAEPHVPIEPRNGVGHGCTEAPRGILYHRYRIAASGTILDARIVPPTSQNQPTIEADLAHFVEGNLELSQEELTWKCEQAIRNYDPCISCATHFLTLEVEREGAGRVD
jgi:coenzyme F420-reducing hydrogenase alpha subunit